MFPLSLFSPCRAGLWSVVALVALLGVARADNPVTVTITRTAPIESMAADGSVNGVTRATEGTRYTLVSFDGARVIVQDDKGEKFRIQVGATDYVPPAVAATPAPAPNAAATPTPAASPSAQTPVSTAPVPAPSVPTTPSPAATAPVSDESIAAVNKSFGKPLFTAQSLWDESALLVANRLGLKLEGRTKWESSYRKYFYAHNDPVYDPAPIFGGQAYCVTLYADANDHPTSLLIAFANDGDYKSIARLFSQVFDLQHPEAGKKAPEDADKKIQALNDQIQQTEAGFEADRQAEEASITKTLNGLFGDAERTNFGTDAATRENVLRWTWHAASFLLTSQENKYNLLRIIPPDLADNHGRVSRTPRDEMLAKLSDGVEHRPNGDVVITQIPMADQGYKGYCVPATWERVLRYEGIPGDMYTLSRVGGTGFGGGTSVNTVVSQLNDTLHSYGCHAESVNVTKIDTLSLHRYLDKGIPVFWCLNPGGYDTVEERYELADRAKDWDTWKKLLDQFRSGKVPKDQLPYEGGHQVLIIGYNPDTKEIAWSDPWGRHTQERWMTQEEAQRCTLGTYYIISL